MKSTPTNSAVNREDCPDIIVAACLFSTFLMDVDLPNVEKLLKFWKGVSDRKNHRKLLELCYSGYKSSKAIYSRGILKLELYSENEEIKAIVDKAISLKDSEVLSDLVVTSSLLQELNYYVLSNSIERMVGVVEAEGASTERITSLANNLIEDLYSKRPSSFKPVSLKEATALMASENSLTPLKDVMFYSPVEGNNLNLTFGVPQWENAGVCPLGTEVSAVIAPQNAGKTSYAAKLAYINYKRGAKVLYITTEENTFNITQAIYAASGVSPAKAGKYKAIKFCDGSSNSEAAKVSEDSEDMILVDFVKKEIPSVFKLSRVQQLEIIDSITSDNGIIIKEFASNSSTALDIQSFIDNEANQGKIYDLILLDHFHALKFNDRATADEKKSEIDSQAAILKQIAQVYRCSFIVFFQAPPVKEWHDDFRLGVIGSTSATTLCSVVMAITHLDDAVFKELNLRMVQLRKFRKTFNSFPASLLTFVDRLHGDVFNTFQPFKEGAMPTSKNSKVKVNEL